LNQKRCNLIQYLSVCQIQSNHPCQYELYAGVRGDDELNTLDSLVSLFRVVTVSPALARAGGLFKRDYAKSHGIGLADAIIAATTEKMGPPPKSGLIAQCVPGTNSAMAVFVPDAEPFSTLQSAHDEDYGTGEAD